MEDHRIDRRSTLKAIGLMSALTATGGVGGATRPADPPPRLENSRATGPFVDEFETSGTGYDPDRWNHFSHKGEEIQTGDGTVTITSDSYSYNTLETTRHFEPPVRMEVTFNSWNGVYGSAVAFGFIDESTFIDDNPGERNGNVGGRARSSVTFEFWFDSTGFRFRTQDDSPEKSHDNGGWTQWDSFPWGEDSKTTISLEWRANKAILYFDGEKKFERTKHIPDGSFPAYMTASEWVGSGTGSATVERIEIRNEAGFTESFESYPTGEIPPGYTFETRGAGTTAVVSESSIGPSAVDGTNVLAASWGGGIAGEDTRLVGPIDTSDNRSFKPEEFSFSVYDRKNYDTHFMQIAFRDESGSRVFNMFTSNNEDPGISINGTEVIEDYWKKGWHRVVATNIDWENKRFDIDIDDGAFTETGISFEGSSVYELYLRPRGFDRGDFLVDSIRVGSSGTPIASFSIGTESPGVGESVTFDAGSSTDSDGTIETYEWDFDGDESVDATGSSAEYTYDEAGEYTVTLTVTDESGRTATAKERIEIAADESLTASFQRDRASPMARQVVQFDASGSADPDGSIQSYEWDFTGDGSVDATGVVAEHVYDSPGTYSVTLTVTDSQDSTTTETVSLSVDPATLPVAIDDNNNGVIDDEEIDQATQYWQNGTEVSGTDGETISDSDLLELTRMWRNETEVDS